MVTQNIKKYKNLYKNIGPIGSHLVTELIKAKKVVFTIKEASEILNANNEQVKKLCYKLVQKGWLKRIEKGKYFLIPLEIKTGEPYTENQFQIASILIAPYYIGFWTMLNYYGYTEQLANTVFIASSKRKKSFNLLGVEYKFINTPSYKMFGIVEIKINDAPVNVSDKEKTLLDCLDHPEYSGGIIEAAKGIWNAREDIHFAKMLEYTQNMRNSAIAKRLGYLIELLDLAERFRIERLKTLIANGYSPLDPLMPKKGHYNSRWNILVNISPEEILSFRRA